MLTGVKGKGGREKEEKLYFSIGVVKMSIQRQVLKVCLWPRRMEVVMPWQWSGRGAADGQARNVKAVHGGEASTLHLAQQSHLHTPSSASGQTSQWDRVAGTHTAPGL